jgi:hypothetical protein
MDLKSLIDAFFAGKSSQESSGDTILNSFRGSWRLAAHGVADRRRRSRYVRNHAVDFGKRSRCAVSASNDDCHGAQRHSVLLMV